MAAEGRRQLGIVRWFSAQKGFGFITINSTGEDLFVHQTAILSRGFRTLNEGDEVEFSVKIGYDNCARAADVYFLCKKVNSSGNMSAQKMGGDDNRLHAGPEPCHTCGMMGHVATDCRSGNMSAQNRGGDDSRVHAGPEPCYTCGNMGHFAKDCRSGNMSVQKKGGDDSTLHAGLEPCYTCGKMGHFATDCKSGGNYGAYMRSEQCYNCGKFGHFARDCCILLKKKVAKK